MGRSSTFPAISPLLPILLAALWTVTVPPAESAATQQQVTASLQITPDELWQLLDRSVTAATQPLASKLDSRIDTLDARLDVLDARVDGLVEQQYKHVSDLVSFISRLESQSLRLDETAKQSNNTAAQLRGHESRLDIQESLLDATTSRLGGQEERMEEQTSRIHAYRSEIGGQASQINTHESRLDNHTSQFGTHQSLLDGHASQIDTQQSLLNGHASQFDTHQVLLDGHTSLIDTHQSLLNEHTSQIKDQKSHLNTILNRTEIQQLGIACNTIRLQSLQTLSSRRDCSDLPAGSSSGVYLLQPGLDGSVRVPAFCDLDSDVGNWTVLQRRADIQPRQSFYLEWAAYREGFVDLELEFWWGLHNMWTMTAARDRRYELRINLDDFEGEKRFAVYQGFRRISSEEDGYRLTAANYSGDAGDSLTHHIGQRFSTRDKDQDSAKIHCANHKHLQAGWWYNNCWRSNLNGRYLIGEKADHGGLAWKHWRGWRYSLKNVEMKIRPTAKLQED